MRMPTIKLSTMMAIVVAVALYLWADATWGRGRICRERARRHEYLAKLYTQLAGESPADRAAFLQMADDEKRESRYYQDTQWRPWVVLAPMPNRSGVADLPLFTSVAEPLAWLAIPAGLLFGVAKVCRSRTRFGQGGPTMTPKVDATEP